MKGKYIKKERDGEREREKDEDGYREKCVSYVISEKCT